MSKKDRLKAQKQKQEKLKKQAELDELKQKEEYESGSKESKAVRKMKKQSGIKDEPFYYMILKIIMLLGYGYSVFFYGSITIIGILGKYIEPTPPKWVLWVFIGSWITITAGMFLSFFKRYFSAFVLCIGGMIAYLHGANYMIEKIQMYLRTHTVKPELMDMDKEYMLRYYPIGIVGFISFVLLVITVIRLLLIRMRKQQIKDTAPVRSIVEE
ncbi:MAG: hypothetical protein IJ571_07445 [Ruminococcus sp.]|nr:hypothetical protein [Ruminococcus sp.]